MRFNFPGTNGQIILESRIGSHGVIYELSSERSMLGGRLRETRRRKTSSIFMVDLVQALVNDPYRTGQDTDKRG
jgi:hypothetical protein